MHNNKELPTIDKKPSRIVSIACYVIIICLPLNLFLSFLQASSTGDTNRRLTDLTLRTTMLLKTTNSELNAMYMQMFYTRCNTEHIATNAHHKQASSKLYSPLEVQREFIEYLGNKIENEG